MSFMTLFNNNGALVFSQLPTSSKTPINGNQLTNKKYVDKGDIIHEIYLNDLSSNVVNRALNIGLPNNTINYCVNNLTIIDISYSSLGIGMDNDVNSLAVDNNGNLYAVGFFTTAGDISANHIAKWDGSSWSALGSGINGPVFSLAIDNNGNLYAGGIFTTAGDVSCNSIAKWDGSTWSALGSGSTGSGSGTGSVLAGTGAETGTGSVRAIAIDVSGHVYVGGDFITAGDISANNIAKWDGSNWSALDSGMNESVRSLVVDINGQVYAGGFFTRAGYISANHIAKWDGSSWTTLGNGMDNFVYALAIDTNQNLYAGGDFTIAGGISANCIAKWDSSSWSAVDSGMVQSVKSIAVDGSGNVYPGGDFTTAGGVICNYIAKWDGSTWSTLGTLPNIGMNTPVQSLAIDTSGNLYAGGMFTTAGGVVCNHVAKIFYGLTGISLILYVNDKKVLQNLLPDKAANVTVTNNGTPYAILVDYDYFPPPSSSNNSGNRYLSTPPPMVSLQATIIKETYIYR